MGFVEPIYTNVRPILHRLSKSRNRNSNKAGQEDQNYTWGFLSAYLPD